jgi:hypothetical protein
MGFVKDGQREKLTLHVGKTVFGDGFAVRVAFSGRPFPRFFPTEAEATEFATRVRKSLNRSGSKRTPKKTVDTLVYV